MKKLITTLTVFGLASMMVVGQTFAQGKTSNIIITREEGKGVSDIGVLISAVFNAAIIIAAIVVFGMLILGGYGWLTAGGDKGKVEEARTRITNALIGLAIVASAWAIAGLIGNFFGVSFNDFTIKDATGTTFE